MKAPMGAFFLRPRRRAPMIALLFNNCYDGGNNSFNLDMGQYCPACECPCDEHPVHAHGEEEEDEPKERRSARRPDRRERPWRAARDGE